VEVVECGGGGGSGGGGVWCGGGGGVWWWSVVECGGAVNYRPTLAKLNKYYPLVLNSFFRITGKKGKMRKRASKLTALEMLSKKYQQKAELKDKELNLRKMELDFEKKNILAKPRKDMLVTNLKSCLSPNVLFCFGFFQFELYIRRT
jgi:hypothetical protein